MGTCENCKKTERITEEEDSKDLLDMSEIDTAAKNYPTFDRNKKHR